MQSFASDNQAGMCPEALAALQAANVTGHEPSYGEDRWSVELSQRMRSLFEIDCETFLVFNGTAANALVLAQLCKPYEAVIAHALSHIETDEAAAPEHFMGGGKILTADTPGAKLTPAAVEALATRWEGFHHVKARVLSLTQSTELGTVYAVDEVRALAAVARRHGLAVHMDGARFANAVATLGCSPAEAAPRAGVDVLSFGGTKNGLAIGEAVVFFDRALARDFAWRVKQTGQLASKMRLVAAPWCAMLENDVWLRNARHANAMARRLADRIDGVPGVRIMFPVEANAVFADIPPATQAAARSKGWRFYTFLGETGCRLMCAWDTAAETVDRFASDLASTA
ncbi:MAG: low specificity L-threonine aldolase [Hyphomicrobiaceae bacterium]|nr:low specificity L-threonine aldolase [Hyphomicrobiaceae bacterium]